VSAVVAAAAVTVALVATFSAKSGTARPVPRATAVAVAVAAAVAVEVSWPGRPTARFAAAATGRPAAGAQAIAVPADGSLVRVAAVRAGATTGPDAAAGMVAAVRVQLLDGEIAADTLTVSATAGAPKTTALSITNLTVLGARIAARPGSRVAVGDWAVLEVGARRAAGGGHGGGTGAAVDALRLRLVAPHRGIPAGTLVVVGRVGAAGAPPPRPRTPAAHTAARTVAAIGGPAPLTPGGRAFPVVRRTTVTDTYGALRAGVGWHHGDDLFAPRGTPVVAVADGTVFDVGWNARGGHRLWLRDPAGNTFYYAHLDAYTAVVREGARVRAGQLLGTLGSSGDAERTPPHLHFEVHPAALAPLGYDGAVDPTPYLAAWARGNDLAVTAVPPLPTRRAAAGHPAAFLLEADDR
jgi:murein DD-endopeptidase MepM/ murein hydrolase activator NlpD